MAHRIQPDGTDYPPFDPRTNGSEPMEITPEDLNTHSLVQTRLETTLNGTFVDVNLRNRLEAAMAADKELKDQEQRNIALEERVQQQTPKMGNLTSPVPVLQPARVLQRPTLPPIGNLGNSSQTDPNSLMNLTLPPLVPRLTEPRNAPFTNFGSSHQNHYKPPQHYGMPSPIHAPVSNTSNRPDTAPSDSGYHRVPNSHLNAVRIPMEPGINPHLNSGFQRNASHERISVRTVQTNPINDSKKYLDRVEGLLLSKDPDCLEGALGYANLAIKIDPKNAVPYAYKSEVLRMMKNLDESEAAANRALEIDPKNIVALVNKSIALTFLHQWEDSLIGIRKVLEMQPDNPHGLRNKIENLYYLGNRQEAMETVTFALQKYPKDHLVLRFKSLLDNAN